MTAAILCVLALATAYWAGKRSLGVGLIILMAWGYGFGITRANLMSPACYFIFDAALLGVYLSQRTTFLDDPKRLGTLRIWTSLLILWPALVLLMPFQPMLVALVGFRGSVLFLPMLLLGSLLRDRDIRLLAMGLAILDIVALTFAGMEYFMGVPRFYPENAATLIIYSSVDVVGGFYRIPAIFANAHLYGGTMVASIPYMVGGWDQAKTRTARVIPLIGIAAALLGVLMSATRQNFIVAGLMVVVAMWNQRMKPSRRVIFALVIVALAVVALRNERFQRFKSLSDTDYVEGRISGSVNRGFFEILLEYPMGNGLGGGGTSIPYFLEGRVRNPIGMENEYARILSEQGIIGLALWFAFIVWYFMQLKYSFGKGPWSTARKLAWCSIAFWLVTGMVGTGMLTAIPSTAMMLMGMGWTAVRMHEEIDPRKYVAMKTPILKRSVPRPVPAV
jgi:hypothetical protein